jgi:hypothetical protein
MTAQVVASRSPSNWRITWESVWGWRWRTARVSVPSAPVERSPAARRQTPATRLIDRGWMAWHMRAIARATGLPTARVDDGYLRQCLAYVRQVVAGQRAFHVDNARRSERIDHHLHRIALWLLGATVVCILIHLLGLLHSVPALHHSPVGHVLGHLHRWGPVLILCCGAFPALGAALHGIKNQAELARVAKRSEAMASQLRVWLAAITRIEQAETLRSADVIPLAREAADLMVDEVLDWRVIFLDRPPALPA